MTCNGPNFTTPRPMASSPRKAPVGPTPCSLWTGVSRAPRRPWLHDRSGESVVTPASPCTLAPVSLKGARRAPSKGLTRDVRHIPAPEPARFRKRARRHPGGASQAEKERARRCARHATNFSAKCWRTTLARAASITTSSRGTCMRIAPERHVWFGWSPKRRFRLARMADGGWLIRVFTLVIIIRPRGEGIS